MPGFGQTLGDRYRFGRYSVLAALYGAGPGTLGSRLAMSTEDARLLRENFLAAFPDPRAGLEGSARTALEHGAIRIVSGLVRHATAIPEPTWKVRNWGLNTPIQGAAADVSAPAISAADRGAPA